MRRGGIISSALALAALAGCGRPCERYAYHDREPADTHRVIVVRTQRPASLLMDGAGVDAVALNFTRSDWPSAFRDFHEGEAGSYRTTFYDAQGGTPWDGFGGGLWGNDYVWRQFRSERVGSFSR